MSEKVEIVFIGHTPFPGDELEEYVYSSAAHLRENYICKILQKKFNIFRISYGHTKIERKNKVKWGINSVYLPSYKTRIENFLLTPIAMCRILQKCLEQDTKVIIYNVYIPTILALLFLKITLRFPFEIILQLEDRFEPGTIKRLIYNQMEKLMLSITDKVICSNKILQKQVDEKNLKSITHSGYLLDQDIHEIPLNTQIPKIVYAGGYDEARSIEKVVDYLVASRVKCELHLFGDKSQINSNKETRCNLTIFRYGYVSDGVLHEHLLTADYCLNWQNNESVENFPSKVTLYGSYGCEIISNKTKSLLNSIFKDHINFIDLAQSTLNLKKLPFTQRMQQRESFVSKFKKQDEELLKWL